MKIAVLRPWFDAHTRWEKVALAVWCAMLLFVSVRVFISPEAKTVYTIFSASGRYWWSGTDLYEPHRPKTVRDGYRYSPAFAVLITPFAVLPDSIGGVLWRLFGAAVMLVSLVWFAHSVLPQRLSESQLAWLLLLTIPLGVQSVNSGQVNILVVGCMLATLAAVKEERWNLASLCMAVTFLCKLYPLALGMVLIVLYPRQLLWRMPLACAATLLVPFLCQHPDYVVDQYTHWFALLRADDRANIPAEHMYRDLWLLIHLYGLPISRTVYTILQFAAGAGVAALCWHRQQAGWSQQALLTSTLALTATWMMLLGPATESSSYVLLAPSFAWSIVKALQFSAWQRRHLLLAGSYALFTVAVVTGGFSSTVRVHALGVHSWAALLYFIYLLTEPRPAVAQEMQSPGFQRSAA